MSRFSRYSGFVDEDQLLRLHATIIGCGAVGRQLALALAAMGCGNLTLIDGDEVEEVNLGTQGYRPDQMGELKAEVLAQDCVNLNPEMNVTADSRMAEGIDPCDVAFIPVDSMGARGKLLSNVRDVGRFIDTRVGGEMFRVISGGRSFIKDTLIDDSEAMELPCNERMILYSANQAANVAIYFMAAWLRGYEDNVDTTFGLAEFWLNGLSIGNESGVMDEVGA